MSAAAKSCGAWFRQLARALKTCRLYRIENPLVQNVRESAVESLLQAMRGHDDWTLRFTPTEILLGQERVVGVSGKANVREENITSPESRLPFLFYRDGIRSIRIMSTIPRAEALEFFDALVVGCNDKVQTDDLVTLLWQANLSQVAVEAAPLEQTFYFSNQQMTVSETRGRSTGAAVTGAVSGTEVRAQLGQTAGGQGLHLDTFDDWGLATETVDVPAAFEKLQQTVEPSRQHVLDMWTEEKDCDWDARVPELFRGIAQVDPTEDTRAALACATGTWVTGMIEQHHLARAARALALLDELDVDRTRAAEVMLRGLGQVNAGELADYLDEADATEQGRFAALMVRIGTTAVPLTYEVMGRAMRSRVRAASATALCYLCAEQPDLLQAFLDEPRVDAMLNLVFVLGQIGGVGVVDMLRHAAQHPDPRVRRQAVLSLGGVPVSERTPVLLDELARLDPHILSTALSLLARQRDEINTRFILSLIKDPEFETRSEDVQRAMFGALAEVADDGVVAALDKLLNRGGGWLVRRSYTQFAAALTLRRIDSPAARHTLAAGLKSKNGTVRTACIDAMNARVT
jgi:HEAT repeat protein